MNEQEFIKVIQDNYREKSGFIGISGLSGSGKTTLAKKLCDIFSHRAVLVPFDDFCIVSTKERKSYLTDALEAKDKERLKHLREPNNPDNPYADPLTWYDWQAIADTLNSLREGNPVTRKNAWDQTTGLSNKVVTYAPPDHDHPLYFLECVYMHEPELEGLIDEVVMIAISTELSHQRRAARDSHRSNEAYLYYKDLGTDLYCIPYLDKYRHRVNYVVENIGQPNALPF